MKRGCILKSAFVLGVLLLFPLSALSQDLPLYSISINDPKPAGFYFLTPLKVGTSSEIILPYHLVLDAEGNTVYYKKFASRQNTSDFKMQPNGMLSYFYKDKFYLLDSSFTLKDSVFCKNNISQDAHDLLLLPNGHYVLLGYENKTMNLSSYHVFNKHSAPGSDSAKVKCSVIQEQDAFKHVVFEWHAHDHLRFDDMDTFYLKDPAHVDWTHFNSLERDTDGNFIVSARNFNEVLKIDRGTGEITWRLGGKRNQFSFPNDSSRFVAQHGARRLKNGNIALLDNGRKGPPLHPTYAKEYKLDEAGKIAELVWKYEDNPDSHSEKGLGNVQRLANGNTLINFGISNTPALFAVINTKGEKIFELAFKDTLRSYRVFYSPTLPPKIKRPAITVFEKDGKHYLDAGSAYASYLWSSGEKTQTISISKPGNYTVRVPIGDGGFIYSPVYSVKNF